MQVTDPAHLARLMENRRVSQRQLAAAAGWGPKSHSFVARLTKGHAKAVSVESAVRIAHYLGVPVDEIFATKLDSITVQIHPKSSSARKAA